MYPYEYVFKFMKCIIIVFTCILNRCILNGCTRRWEETEYREYRIHKVHLYSEVYSRCILVYCSIL